MCAQVFTIKILTENDAFAISIIQNHYPLSTYEIH